MLLIEYKYYIHARNRSRRAAITRMWKKAQKTRERSNGSEEVQKSHPLPPYPRRPSYSTLLPIHPVHALSLSLSLSLRFLPLGYGATTTTVLFSDFASRASRISEFSRERERENGDLIYLPRDFIYIPNPCVSLSIYFSLTLSFALFLGSQMRYFPFLRASILLRFRENKRERVVLQKYFYGPSCAASDAAALIREDVFRKQQRGGKMCLCFFSNWHFNANVDSQRKLLVPF